jgi:hypothetical protein
MIGGAAGRYAGGESITAHGRCGESQSVGLLSVVSVYFI